MDKLIRSVPLRYTKAFREQGGARGAFETELRTQGLEPQVITTVVKRYHDREDLIRRRLMLAGDTPVQLAVTIIPASLPADLVAALAEEDTGPGGIMSRLADSGLEPVRFRETIVSLNRRPKPGEEDLECGPHDDGCFDPVAELLHEAFAADGTLVESTTCVLPCHFWTLEYSWDAE